MDTVMALMLLRLVMTAGGLAFMFADMARRPYVKGTHEYHTFTRIMRVMQYPALLWGPSALAANVAIGFYFMIPVEILLTGAVGWIVLRFRREDDHDDLFKRGKRGLKRALTRLRDSLTPTPAPMPTA